MGKSVQLRRHLTENIIALNTGSTYLPGVYFSGMQSKSHPMVRLDWAEGVVLQHAAYLKHALGRLYLYVNFSTWYVLWAHTQERLNESLLQLQQSWPSSSDLCLQLPMSHRLT